MVTYLLETAAVQLKQSCPLSARHDMQSLNICNFPFHHSAEFYNHLYTGAEGCMACGWLLIWLLLFRARGVSTIQWTFVGTDSAALSTCFFGSLIPVTEYSLEKRHKCVVSSVIQYFTLARYSAQKSENYLFSLVCFFSSKTYFCYRLSNLNTLSNNNTDLLIGKLLRNSHVTEQLQSVLVGSH